MVKKLKPLILSAKDKDLLRTVEQIQKFDKFFRNLSGQSSLHYGYLGNIIFIATKGRYTILTDLKKDNVNYNE